MRTAGFCLSLLSCFCSCLLKIISEVMCTALSNNSTVCALSLTSKDNMSNKTWGYAIVMPCYVTSQYVRFEQHAPLVYSQNTFFVLSYNYITLLNIWANNFHTSFYSFMVHMTWVQHCVCCWSDGFSVRLFIWVCMSKASSQSVSPPSSKVRATTWWPRKRKVLFLNHF